MIPETFEDFGFLAMKFLFTFVCYKQWQFPTRNNMGFSVLPLWHVGLPRREPNLWSFNKRLADLPVHHIISECRDFR